MYCIAKHIRYLLHTHPYSHSHTKPTTRTKKNRDEDLYIRISWFHTLWEFVGFPSRWCWWCNAYHIIIIAIIICCYFGLKCCLANVIQFNPFVENSIIAHTHICIQFINKQRQRTRNGNKITTTAAMVTLMMMMEMALVMYCIENKTGKRENRKI